LIVRVRPAIVAVPVLAPPVLFGATDTIIPPVPMPLEPNGNVIHGSLLCAVHRHGGAVTLTKASPPSRAKANEEGAMVAGEFEAVTLTWPVLLPATGSPSGELAVAELAITAPFATVHTSLAAIVMRASAPAANELKVTVRLLPVPAQMPPPVVPQDTKLNSAGRLSVTRTFRAVSGPLFLTVIS
jgi:hypothetical protein